jgi:hypothetical protein
VANKLLFLILQTDVVVYDPTTSLWKWVGDPQLVTTEKLERAEQLFFFALSRHQIVATENGEELHFDSLKGKGGVTLTSLCSFDSFLSFPIQQKMLFHLN